MGITQNTGASSQLKPGVIDNAAARPASPFEGQMIYETDTDVLAIWNGSAWRQLAAAAATSGSVLQVVSATKVNIFSMTSTVTFTDVTGLSVSITPKSTSSKILISFFITNCNEGANHNSYNLVRDSTNLAQPAAASYSSTVGSSIASNQDLKMVSFSHLDSPSTTSSITYKIQARTSGGTLYVNRRGDTADVINSSSITVMEIAG